jgi:hypothetical protein
LGSSDFQPQVAHAVRKEGAGLRVLDQAILPFRRPWPGVGSEPGLPDLAGSFRSLNTGAGGFGGVVVVTVRNEGRWHLEFRNRALFQIRARESGLGSVLYEQPVTVSALHPGQEESLRISIPSSVRTQNMTARLILDYGGSAFETNERNNTISGRMP